MSDKVQHNVGILFEKSHRMLLGLSVACERCGVDDDGVDGYEYANGRRVMLCRQHAEQEGFCYGCHGRYKNISEHMATCAGVEDEDNESRHEAALDYVEDHAELLRNAHRFGNTLATAVLRAYQKYVKDDLYDDDDLTALEQAIETFKSS